MSEQIDRKALKEAALKAKEHSPTPWRMDGSWSHPRVLDATSDRVCTVLLEGDAAFIALANPATILTYEAALDAAEQRERRLREALSGFADDFMTSDKHHPDYVLIPTAVFERVRAAVSDQEA